MSANQTFFVERIILDRRTTYLNITRRSLRISNDALKLLSKTALPVLSGYLPPLKTPLELSNALLQVFAVEFDGNYPAKYKLAMHIALGSLMLSSLSVGLLYPSVQMAAVLLTSYAHLIRTLYRGSKLKLSIDKIRSSYAEATADRVREEKKGQDPSLKIQGEREAELLQLFKRKDKVGFGRKVVPYLKETVAQEDKLYDVEIALIKNTIGVVTILLRWAVSVAIILLASASSSVIVPLISASLVINSLDLLRDAHNEWQMQFQEASLNQRQNELVQRFQSKQ